MSAGGELVVLIGPPGAGKSTFAATLFRPAEIVSLDRFREMCTDRVEDQSATAAAVDLRNMVFDERLSRGLVCVSDATNARRLNRAAQVDQARHWGRPVVAVLFHTTLETCIDRRPEPFPEQVIVDMHAEIGGCWSQLFREADAVVHVSPDGKQAVRIGGLPRSGRPARWLVTLPALPSVEQLPWDVEYGRGGPTWVPPVPAPGGRR